MSSKYCKKAIWGTTHVFITSFINLAGGWYLPSQSLKYTLRVFIWTNIYKNTRDKIEANKIDLNKTNCQQKCKTRCIILANRTNTPDKNEMKQYQCPDKNRWGINRTKAFINSNRMNSPKNSTLHFFCGYHCCVSFLCPVYLSCLSMLCNAIYIFWHFVHLVGFYFVTWCFFINLYNIDKRVIPSPLY